MKTENLDNQQTGNFDPQQLIFSIVASETAPLDNFNVSYLPGLALSDRVAQLQQELPESHEAITDKYFLRSGEILRQEGLNPFVRAQVFIRKGPGQVAGIEEAIALITKHSSLIENEGRIYALEEGAEYDSKETLLVIEGRAQDLIELETEYLGVISEKTSKANGLTDPNPAEVTANMQAVVSRVGGRPVIYMGARHWSFGLDAIIAKAAFDGGAAATSTDIGAATVGQLGMGTIPHALENIMAAKYGRERAVVEATKAFDRIISKEVPRIALIDYNNREITDSIAAAKELAGALSAVRVDTCGENVAEGAIPNYSVYHALSEAIREGSAISRQDILKLAESDLRPDQLADSSLIELWIKTVEQLEAAGIEIGQENSRYWFGSGVSISGVLALRRSLDQANFSDVGIILSSGFASVAKVEAFVEAEKLLGIKLFNALGVGGVFKSWAATMDIVAVADSIEELDQHPMSKVGRGYNPNQRLNFINPALSSNQVDTAVCQVSADFQGINPVSLDLAFFGDSGCSGLRRMAEEFLVSA